MRERNRLVVVLERNPAWRTRLSSGWILSLDLYVTVVNRIFGDYGDDEAGENEKIEDYSEVVSQSISEDFGQDTSQIENGVGDTDQEVSAVEIPVEGTDQDVSEVKRGLGDVRRVRNVTWETTDYDFGSPFKENTAIGDEIGLEVEEVAHHREHRERLQEDGECAWCGDSSHGFKSVARGRLHLKLRSSRNAPDRQAGSIFPIFCDCCWKNFTAQTPDEARLYDRDCILHADVYCTICGFKFSRLTTVHQFVIDQHQQNCKWPGGLRRKFCQQCGEDLVEIEKDHDQIVWHDRNCFKKDGPAINAEIVEQKMQDLRKLESELADREAEQLSLVYSHHT
ncbi:hypothetical protein BJ878DRAFT_475882 [Calycina marina]|uniref:Uncharacterized protein n=1 Tax=Calycina marina TaxID=1763456 RepID=A0A9P8CJP5_9HELO|nr:hypothetical protein BJ878DRAFT_475882 [Calycina marina]